MVAGLNRKLLAVDTMIAAAPHKEQHAEKRRQHVPATRITIASESAVDSPGIAALPNTPTATISVSTTIVPTIQPTTDRRAAPSSLAEKNFWYMFASPIRRSIVGRKSAPASAGIERAEERDLIGTQRREGRADAAGVDHEIHRRATPTPTSIATPLPTSR